MRSRQVPAEALAEPRGPNRHRDRGHGGRVLAAAVPRSSTSSQPRSGRVVEIDADGHRVAPRRRPRPLRRRRGSAGKRRSARRGDPSSGRETSLSSMKAGQISSDGARRSSRLGPLVVRVEAEAHRREQRDRLRRETLAAAGEAEGVGRRRVDGDAPASTPIASASRSPISSRTAPTRGSSPDEDAVRVHELPPGVAHLPVGLPEQVERGRAAVLLVAGGEERPDVAEVGGAQERVDERVGDDVAVRVAGEAVRVVDRARRRGRAARRPRTRARRRRGRP